MFRPWLETLSRLTGWVKNWSPRQHLVHNQTRAQCFVMMKWCVCVQSNIWLAVVVWRWRCLHFIPRALCLLTLPEMCCCYCPGPDLWICPLHRVQSTSSESGTVTWNSRFSAEKRRSSEHHRGNNGIVRLYAGTKEEAKNHAVPIKSNLNPNPCHIFPKFCVFCFNFYLSYNLSTLCHQRGRLIVMDE